MKELATAISRNALHYVNVASGLADKGQASQHNQRD